MESTPLSSASISTVSYSEPRDEWRERRGMNTSQIPVIADSLVRNFKAVRSSVGSVRAHFSNFLYIDKDYLTERKQK